MKKTTVATLTAAVALTAFSAVPASAAGISLGNQFGTSGIRFERDTVVKFQFNRSIGSYQSTLSIYDGNGRNALQELFREVKPADNPTGTPVGSPGNTVLAPFTRYFTFLAGQTYTLGLTSVFRGTSRGTVFSTSALNSGGTQQAVFVSGDQPVLPNPLVAPFVSNPADTGSFSPAAYSNIVDPTGVFTIGFDDQGNGADADYQDFVVQARAIPEPFTLAGTAVAGAGFAIARKRKQQMAAKA